MFEKRSAEKLKNLENKNMICRILTAFKNILYKYATFQPSHGQVESMGYKARLT